jgi:hypothetical protein
MVTIAAIRRAQAADSTRAQAPTAVAPWVPVVEATNESNIVSNVGAESADRHGVEPSLWTTLTLWITHGPTPENVSPTC